MPFLETIKPHLISDDILVQEVVLHALHDYPSVPEEWTVSLLKVAFENETKQSSILIYIDHQKINEEALQVLIENVPQMNPTNRNLALRVLDNVEPKLALEYQEDLKGYINKETWDLYELIVKGTKEEVIQKYEDIVNGLEIAFEQDDYIKAKKLAKWIAENGWITEKEINQILKNEQNGKGFSYKGGLTVYMIGQRKLESFIPALASLLDNDDDTLLEETAAALISFQSDEVVRQVEPYLRKSESVIFAASVLENIKSDLAIDSLRKAYRAAKDLVDQDMLCEALCHHFSKESEPEISKHMKNDYESGIVDVEQVVYSYYTILGLKHPELKIWKQVALERELDFRNESTQGSVPVINENKIGRNDPCPCGSGKKYKKCCGK